MSSEAINKYIEKRYKYWIDYATYHCTYAGIADQATDVMNEVLVMLLEKDSAYIERLYKKKNAKYRELDYFVLRMIKLNIQSPTSPYQHKYRAVPVDENVDFQRLDIVDEEYDDSDYAGSVLEKMQQVRDVIDQLDLSEKARRVFYFKFFEGESLSNWTGPENKKELYDIYNGVLEMVKDKINGYSLF